MKHIKLFSTSAEYEAFIAGDQFVTPNISFISTENLAKYSSMPTNTIFSNGDITLKTSEFGDTKALGIEVYNYLKTKCGNGTNGAIYVLPNNENLYCTYDANSSPMGVREETNRIIEAEMYAVYLDENRFVEYIQLYPYDRSAIGENNGVAPGPASIYLLLSPDGTTESVVG